MTKAFVNQKEHPLDIRGLKGSVTLPIILTDFDLGKYIEVATLNIESIEKNKDKKNDGDVVLKSHLQHDARKHLVLAINFPGVAIDNFRDGDRPYPALIFAITELIDPILNDALNIPKS